MPARVCQGKACIGSACQIRSRWEPWRPSGWGGRSGLPHRAECVRPLYRARHRYHPLQTGHGTSDSCHPRQSQGFPTAIGQGPRGSGFPPGAVGSKAATGLAAQTGSAVPAISPTIPAPVTPAPRQAACSSPQPIMTSVSGLSPRLSATFGRSLPRVAVAAPRGASLFGSMRERLTHPRRPGLGVHIQQQRGGSIGVIHAQFTGQGIGHITAREEKVRPPAHRSPAARPLSQRILGATCEASRFRPVSRKICSSSSSWRTRSHWALARRSIQIMAGCRCLTG